MRAEQPHPIANVGEPSVNMLYNYWQNMLILFVFSRHHHCHNFSMSMQWEPGHRKTFQFLYQNPTVPEILQTSPSDHADSEQSLSKQPTYTCR